MTAVVDAKTCRGCGQRLVRRSDERAAWFAKRRYCDTGCGARSRARQRRESGERIDAGRRLGPNREPGLELDVRWQDRAGCRGVDRELFFADTKSDNDRARVAEARLICAACPVADECLRYALHTDAYGVWGGTTRYERDAIRAAK
jgi:WhiB family redox-sensing transcriptional regulator